MRTIIGIGLMIIALCVLIGFKYALTVTVFVAAFFGGFILLMTED